MLHRGWWDCTESEACKDQEAGLFEAKDRVEPIGASEQRVNCSNLYLQKQRRHGPAYSHKFEV